MTDKFEEMARQAAQQFSDRFWMTLRDEAMLASVIVGHLRASHEEGFDNAVGRFVEEAEDSADDAAMSFVMGMCAKLAGEEVE